MGSKRDDQNRQNCKGQPKDIPQALRAKYQKYNPPESSDAAQPLLADPSTMTNSFYMVLRPRTGRGGVAYGPQSEDYLALDVPSPLDNWHCMTFLLKNGDFEDYQGNDFGWHICSSQLRDVIAANAGARDNI